MKKLMLVVSVLFLVANAFAGQIVPKLGYQMNQTGTVKTGNAGSQDLEMDAATSIGAEYLSALNDMFMVGGGFEYQMMSKWSKMNKNDVASWDLQQAYLPIYGTVQYCFKTSSDSIAPFLKLNLGYNMYSVNSKLKDVGGDPEAGIYYAIGGGAVISKNINVSLLYSSYTAALKMTGGNSDVKTTSIGLQVGYVFSLCCGKSK